jgi:hypothetical protein
MQHKLISVFGMEMRELEKAGGEKKGKAGVGGLAHFAS